MGLKAAKTIWYGNTPPQIDTGKKDAAGNPILVSQPDAIFDKRMKKIKLGEDLPKELDKGVAERMKESGLVVEELSVQQLGKAEQQKLADEAAKKAPKADEKK